MLRQPIFPHDPKYIVIIGVVRRIFRPDSPLRHFSPAVASSGGVKLVAMQLETTEDETGREQLKGNQ